MSEDILKIMEAIREEARAEGAAQPGSDFYKQGLLAPDVRAIVPADWSVPGGRGDLPEEPASWK